MKYIIDMAMSYLPIILIGIIVSCLIYSEFVGTCVPWYKFKKFIAFAFFGKGGVKVLG
jgi:hypothetical protein